MLPINRELTKDSMFNGLLTIYQYKDGYRFSIDAPLLANFVIDEKKNSYIEFGSGSGVISMMLSYLGVTGNIYGVEIQEDLYNLSLFNLENNNLSNITFLNDDVNNLKKHFESGIFDVVFTNPPYRKCDSGKANTHSEKAIARHEMKLNLNDIFKASNYLLKPLGKLKLIYPVDRLIDVLNLLKSYSFGATKIQFIHPRANLDAKLFLFEAVKGSKNTLSIMPPVIIHNENQQYTEYLEKILQHN